MQRSNNPYRVIWLVFFGLGLLMLLNATLFSIFWQERLFGLCCFQMAALCLLVSVVLGVSLAIRQPENSAHVPIVILAACVLPVFWLVADGYLASQRRNARIQKTYDSLTKLVKNIETVRARLGHLPGDESELARELGLPLPKSGWDSKIDYIRFADGDLEHFRIKTWSTGLGSECYYFDSKEASKGIQREPF